MNIISTKYISLILITITVFLFTPELSYEIDTINTSYILRDGGDTLVSSGGTFVLGFFNPENSKNRYVGIWYNKINVKTVVWVANRENPLTDTSGTMKVIESGILVLVNGNKSIIWSTNTSKSVQNPVAQLLDSGNLVVADANDKNPKNFLWQSFEYPTDTSLPGMKLGVNFITGHEVYLTSWKSSDDPASGYYTFHCDPTGYPQNVIKKEGILLYRTGPWNGMGFSGLPNLQKNHIFTYGVVINEDEAYFHYELLKDTIYARITLSESGVAERWIWVEPKWKSYFSMPVDVCDKYGLCGPYGSCNMENSPCGCLDKFRPSDPQSPDKGDWSKGCVRNTPLNCTNGDAFLKYSGIKLPDAQHLWYNTSMSLKECKLLCSRNCSCTAYTQMNISGSGSGCLLWFGDLVDIKEVSPGQDIYIRMASSEIETGWKKREIIIVTLSLFVGILVLFLIVLSYSSKRRKVDYQLQEMGRLRPNTMDNHRDESYNNDLELPQFELSTISRATVNFSINNKLGEGGFGPVYKGVLVEGQEIAVKCLSRTSLQGINEFKNEVICIAKLQHRNLVKLLGWCIEGEEKMLVYEYMANKSLDLVLFDSTKRILLDWPMRFNIINGIARGLLYLHQDSRLRVIHRDLKASNILLDSDMNPKISDFGLARTFGGNETGADTSRIVGTYGYMSPEYVEDGMFSVKSDVFSFGVLVLEIVSGKRNRRFLHKYHGLNLLGHAWTLYNEERSLELVDSCLGSSYYSPEVLRSIHVGLLCVQEHLEDRPIMSSVVLMLSNDGVLPEAKQPGFFTRREMSKGGATVMSTSISSSSNVMSITELQAR